MIEIIIINPENEAPTVVKGDFAFVVADPRDGASNAIFMGHGRMSEVVTTLGVSCRHTLENIAEGNPLLCAALIEEFKQAFKNPNDYAKTYKTDSVPEY